MTPNPKNIGAAPEEYPIRALESGCHILLNNGMRAIVDLEDFPLVSATRWFAHEQKGRGVFYAEREEGGRVVAMHRQILGFPVGVIDHVNGDGLDNRRCNLRIASIAQNRWNSRKGRLAKSSSSYKGVSRGLTRDLREVRWRAEIQVNKKRIWLGTFLTEIEAAKAYNAAAQKYFGEFARLNHISSSGPSTPASASPAKGPSLPEVTQPRDGVELEDPRSDQELVDILERIALDIGAHGGELGSEEELRSAKLDILNRISSLRATLRRESK